VAEADRTPVTLFPEQRLAARFAREQALSLPVDVGSAAAALARVEFDTLPAGVDGVLVRKRGQKPLIIVNVSVHQKRQRFTLAHEIGHILIPWHLGNVGCSPEASSPDASEIERVCEAEANRFASELLLPADYVRNAISGANTIREIYHRLIAADASVGAATIALSQAMPPGHIYAEPDASGRIVLSGRSPGTALPAPPLWTKLDTTRYERADGHEVVLLGQHLIHWWRFEREAELRLLPGAVPDSKALLKDILGRHLRGQAMTRASQTINGVIGAANSAHRAASVAELVAIFKQRFLLHEELAPVTTDPEFAVYLEAKAHEIVGRRVP
jgi:hypothetical protein